MIWTIVTHPYFWMSILVLVAMFAAGWFLVGRWEKAKGSKNGG